MLLLITIRLDNTNVQDARTIYEFLKEAAEPYPGMRLHAQIIQNEDPYVVPGPEPPS